jgi:alpha-D-ribose 1-methylphosphonate 5-triphosphate synthase subunit PhnG
MSAAAEAQDEMIARRQRWLGVMALGDEATLESAFAALDPPPAYELMRRPDVGLVMVRGRVGGVGQAFNLGEMTATRCVVRLACGRIGHGWVAGRAPRKAELIAVFDALLQDAAHPLHDRLITPLAAQLAERRQKRAEETAATRVEFFTLVRGDE